MNTLLLSLALASLEYSGGLYYDQAINACLPLSGGTITGPATLASGGSLSVNNGAYILYKDGACAYWGTDSDYFLCYDNAGQKVTWTTTNSDGGGTDKVLWSADDGFGSLIAGGGVVATGAVAANYTAVDDSLACSTYGITGLPRTNTTDPRGLVLRPQPCNANDGTCAASDVVLYGGQDTSTIAIDGADPSVSCAGDNDSVTFSVYDTNGDLVTVTITEGNAGGGVTWTATASVADTCASLATAISNHSTLGTYLSAVCSSPSVQITLKPTAGSLVMAESTAGCTTEAEGTRGMILLGPPFSAGGFITLGFVGDEDSGIRYSGANDWNIDAGGAGLLRFQSTSVSVGASIQFSPGTVAFASLGTPSNGVIYYCSDCTIANPCAGSGTGAIAKRLNGVWVCN